MFKEENIKQTFQKIYSDIKNFLLKPKSREFFIFLFFFIIAGGFWLLQTLNEEYEADFYVSIDLENTPDNFVLTNEPTSFLSVRVRDKGMVLLNYKLARKFTPIELDFESISKQSKSEIKLPTSILEKKVLSRFSATSKILNILPDSLEYIYTKGKAKRVPVALKGKVEANSLYLVTDTVFTPDSVLVYAPSELLKTIEFAYTEESDLKNISDSTNVEVNLDYIKGVKFVPNNVQLTLPVDILTEKTVSVPIRGVNFPDDKVLRTFPSFVDITFQIGNRSFDSVTPSSFEVLVDYKKIQTIDGDSYPLQISKFPSHIKNIRLWPRQVDFLLEKKMIQND